jgi:hypothetical protein
MDVIRPDMDAEQMPSAPRARIENGVQNQSAIERVEVNSGSMITGYGTRIGAVEVCAVASEGKKDTNRFAHGSESQLHLAPSYSAI